LEFLETDYPVQFVDVEFGNLVDRVIDSARLLSIEVDRELCLSKSQEYLNTLHNIYEKNYDGAPAWLMFHEYIHLCEYHIEGFLDNRMDINYREKAGPLNKPFDISWMQASTTQVRPGDVYIHWTELGKIPYLYWEHNEPEDINRLCELSKPWLTFQPLLTLALSDRNFLKDKNIKEFNTWWAKYSEQWCQHWNIPKWSIEDQYSVIVIGHVPQFQQVSELLKQHIYPIKIQL
jgi:hypothetical protein